MKKLFQSKPAATATIALLLAVGAAPAQAGVITAQGAVTALTDISQMSNTNGFANFDGGGTIPANAYSALGLTLAGTNTGTSFSSILPGIVSTGTAYNVLSLDDSGLFPGTIGGGGTISGQQGVIDLVGTFSGTVTQVGATFSDNGTQYLTAWSSDGALIGQVTWSPLNDASFVGLDSGSTPIAMIAYGNDNVFAGATYDPSGTTTIFDNMVWNINASPVPEPATLALLGLGLAGLGFSRRKEA